MRLKNLLEMVPQNIPDLDYLSLSIADKNAEMYKDCLRKSFSRKIKILQLMEYAVIYKFKSEFFCLDSKEKRITYFMKYEVSNNGTLGQFVWQSLVWLDPRAHLSYLERIPAKIFFDYLLPKFHTILTDSEQTWHGRRFWEYRIAEAFNKNLNVYFFNFENRQIMKLNSFDELSDFQMTYDIWGDSPRHKMKRMVITDKELPLKNNSLVAQR